MDLPRIMSLTSDLISCRSLSGDEYDCMSYLERLFKELGWQYCRLPIAGSCPCLLVQFGQPQIVFSTHIDVVDGPDCMFRPELGLDRIKGRGACDAKGIIASMVWACCELQKSNQTDFALLLVTEEESTGRGAKIAAQKLKGRGIRYLVNGEPTMNRLISAHKGALGFKVVFKGKSCHSGYPTSGIDANKKLLEAAARLRNVNFGEDALLGSATLNLGVISGGTAGNVISAQAELIALVRTVCSNSRVEDLVRSAVGDLGEIAVDYNMPAVKLTVLPGFETDMVSYCTDIPNFAPLGCESLLYGPGSIELAHSDDESISWLELIDAKEGYLQLFKALKEKLNG